MKNPAQNNFVVLVVDDDETTRRILRSFLEREGYTVIEASDGPQALSTYERLRPDMVLLDAMMPIVDGFTTCARLRKLPGGDRVPVLMLTGLKDHKSMDLALEAGATEFVTKPILFKILSQRIRRLLHARQTEVLLDRCTVGEKFIISSALDGIITIDVQNMIKSFNPAAERIFGYASSEVIGQNVKILMPGAIREQGRIAESKRSGEDNTFSASREITGLRKDGSAFPAELTISGYYTGERLLTVRDVTERKQAENKLRLAAKVFENIAEGIIVTDPGGVIHSVNPAFIKITGYSEEEVTGKHASMLAAECLSEESTQKMMTGMLTLQWRGETWIKRKNGETIPIWMEIQPIKDDDGQVTQCVIFFVDISEWVRIREEKRRLREQAARAQRLATLSTMSAGIAHEINQPLNSIKVITDGMLYWHKRDRFPEPDKVVENLRKISANVGRIDEIVKYIRSFVRAEHTAKMEPCSLNDALEGAMKVLASQMSSHGIVIRKELSGDLPLVLGNINRLEEVVINLLVNAMQALDTVSKTEKEISCRTGSVGEKVFLEISDNATGVSEEIKEDIFEPFYSTKQAGVGMGLGLSIVQTIVSSFKGLIEVSNNEKGGATFRVELPALKKVDRRCRQ